MTALLNTHNDDRLRFDVVGEPAPQGSKTRMPNGAMIEGSSTTGRARHKSWRAEVANAARTLTDHHGPYTSPVEVVALFRFRMPASRSAAIRRQGWAWKSTKPDGDKLLRSTLDALVHGGLLKDDALVVSCTWRKVELVDGWTGAELEIRPANTLSIPILEWQRMVAP